MGAGSDVATCEAGADVAIFGASWGGRKRADVQVVRETTVSMCDVWLVESRRSLFVVTFAFLNKEDSCQYEDLRSRR